ncbi:hypothetical protein GGI12_005629, partial [Dipsacomyces acuminosporus]
MVAKEAKTSDAAKETIVATPGLDDSEWEKTFDGAHGGIITIQTSYGENGHFLATRGVLLLDELNRTIFSKPREEHAELLLARKDEIIERLNKDYMRPWFGKKADGSAADLEDMTYAEVINRLVELLYVRHQSRWIDQSYKCLVFDFIRTMERRLCLDSKFYILMSISQLDTPYAKVAQILGHYPESQTQLITSEDAQHFTNLCRRRGRRSVPFVFVFDSEFSVWLKKDLGRPSEDVDAVFDQDVQRTCIQHGPVAARYSTKANEPVKDILDGIYHGQIDALLERHYDGDKSKVPTVEYLGPETHGKPELLPASAISSVSDSARVYCLPPDESLLPDEDSWISTIVGPEKSWLRAMLTSPYIVQGSSVIANGLRLVIRPQPSLVITVNEAAGKPISLEIAAKDGSRELDITAGDGNVISLVIYHSAGTAAASVCLRYQYCPSNILNPIHEILDGRDESIRSLFASSFLNTELAAGVVEVDSAPYPTFEKKGVAITAGDIGAYCRTIGNTSKHYIPNTQTPALVPMDYISVLTRGARYTALTTGSASHGLLNLVHQAHHI